MPQGNLRHGRRFTNETTTMTMINTAYLSDSAIDALLAADRQTRKPREARFSKEAKMFQMLVKGLAEDMRQGLIESLHREKQARKQVRRLFEEAQRLA
jgi:hypothetical protein